MSQTEVTHKTQNVSVMVFKRSGKWLVGGPDEDFNPLIVKVPFNDNLEKIWDSAVAIIREDYGVDCHVMILATPGHPHDHPTLRVGKRED